MTKVVIPAQTVIPLPTVIPAKAGIQKSDNGELDSRFRGNDEQL